MVLDLRSDLMLYGTIKRSLIKVYFVLNAEGFVTLKHIVKLIAYSTLKIFKSFFFCLLYFEP